MEQEDQNNRARQDEELPLLITEDMLVPARPKDDRLAFEKGMSRFPLLIALLIIFNTVIFGWQIATGALTSKEMIIQAGALEREHVLQGEYWRLLSAAILHGGLGHLASNSVFMFVIGMAGEHAFGIARTGMIYLVSALSGSLLSLSLSSGPSIGASGAVFGLMGATVVLFYKNRSRFYLRDQGIGTFMAALAVLEIASGFFDPYIDNWAHIGGFIGGAAMAFVFKPVRFMDEQLPTISAKVRAYAAISMTVLCLAVFYGLGFFASLQAVVYTELAQRDKAIAAASQSLELNDGNSYAYFLRGVAYLGNGRTEEAIQDLNIYIQRQPRNDSALYRIGHAYCDRGLFEPGIGYFTQALDLAPGNVHYLNSRGYAYILTGQYQQARGDFEALLGIDAKYAMGYGNLGLVYAIEGNYPKAVELLRKAQRLDSSQEKLAKLIEALEYEIRGKRSEAMKSYGLFIQSVKERSAWLAEIRFAESRIRVLSGGR